MNVSDLSTLSCTELKLRMDEINAVNLRGSDRPVQIQCNARKRKLNANSCVTYRYSNLTVAPEWLKPAVSNTSYSAAVIRPSESERALATVSILATLRHCCHFGLSKPRHVCLSHTSETFGHHIKHPTRAYSICVEFLYLILHRGEEVIQYAWYWSFEVH